MGSQLLIAKDRIIWIVDAHRGDGKRFVVRTDGKLTAFSQPHLTKSRHASPHGGVDSVYSLFNGGESRRWTVGSPSRQGIELFN
ncbi:MAG: hypothetical protein DME75_08530 [Verrucomicrobia bacterium]|nr:MAG: hypothetical protein DME75_08530 [Verrucomicrobiota bacterium]